MIFYMIYLHDGAKLRIPEACASSREYCETEKVAIMSPHVKEYLIRDFFMLYFSSKFETVHPYIRAAMLYHHWRKDGTGYPKKIVRPAINTCIANFVATVDIYTALIEDRNYRKGRQIEPSEAIEIVQSSVVGNSLDAGPLMALRSLIVNGNRIIKAPTMSYMQGILERMKHPDFDSIQNFERIISFC